MTALPEPLRPWAATLSLFPVDLALALGTSVARLDVALGAFRARDQGDQGEPEGHDGLTRRGPVERLLLSEWLLALEEPDEFLRRAAYGEQAFLQPAFRQPRAGRCSVALLDAGPEQLGAPRIAHLALLVVLARRAEAAGADFRWGVIQADAGRGFQTRLDKASLGPWLKQARAEPPTAERLAAWREALEPEQDAGEVWLVGGPRLARLAGVDALSRVGVEEALEPGARRLTVRVEARARSARTVELELPPAPLCVRLLRDPFTPPAPPRPQKRTSGEPPWSPARSLRFSPDGLRLLLSHEDGSVSSQAVLHSPKATQPRRMRFMPRQGERVVAFGWRAQGGALLLLQRGNTLRLQGHLQGRRSGVVSWTLDAPPPWGEPLQGAPPWPLLSRSRAVRDEYPLLLDAQGHLHALTPERPLSSSTPPLLRNVLALAEARGGRLFYVRDGAPGASRPVWYSGHLDFWERELMGEPIAPGCQAFFNLGLPPKVDTQGICLALVGPKGAPLLLRDSCRTPGERPAGWNDAAALGTFPLCVGLVRRSERPDSLGLLALGFEAGKTRVRFVPAGPGESFTVEFDEELLFPAVSAALPVLAWLTRAGEVKVYSLQRQCLLPSPSPKGSP